MNIIGINLTNKTKFDYVNMNDNNSETLILLKKNFKFLLIENNVPIDKIKFISKEYFYYNIETKEINPKQIVLSKKEKKNTPLIINSNKNIIKVGLKHYHSLLNIFEFIRNMIKISKNGVVIMITNEFLNNNCDNIYMLNLDEITYNNY